MKILKLTNSAFYGLQEEVHNTKRAIIVLGFQTVKNIALTASVCDLFKSKNKSTHFPREELWKHSVAVAVCAKSIAQRVNLDREEDIFTAGLLHDIGIIIEDQYLNTDFIRVLNNPSHEELEFIEGPHEPKRYRVNDLKGIHDEFKQKLKDLERLGE